MYIKLDDAINAIDEKYLEGFCDIINEVKSLPTINPSKIIDDMIEEIKNNPNYHEIYKNHTVGILEEYRNKINQ